jgi:hypothetical protein
MRDVRGLFIFCALVAWSCQQAAAADPCAEGKLRPVTVDASGALHLTWIGTVNERMAKDIDRAFEANKRQVKSVELALQSCGGRIDYMAAVIGVLHHIKETHALATVVERGSTCASACIPIFLASDQRRAALSSLWFFHRSWRHQLTGGVDAVLTSVPGSHSVQRFLDQYYAPAGVSRDWLTRLKDVIEKNDGYWQTGADLWTEKTGMITETIGNTQPQDNRPIYLAPAPGCTAMCRG